MLKEQLEKVRGQMPLIHNITNYVTVNDCANILLACGGSPIMADDLEEAEEITAVCGGLNINIGTLNRNTIPSMLAAGKKANACGHPVLFDPVAREPAGCARKLPGDCLRKYILQPSAGTFPKSKPLRWEWEAPEAWMLTAWMR